MRKTRDGRDGQELRHLLIELADGEFRCKAAGLPRATWLTFRRTFSSWAHQQGLPPKVVAIMGHTKVETTLNVYTQVLDGAAREAADRVESGLFRIVQKPEMGKPLTH